MFEGYLAGYVVLHMIRRLAKAPSLRRRDFLSEFIIYNNIGVGRLFLFSWIKAEEGSEAVPIAIGLRQAEGLDAGLLLYTRFGI